MPLKQQLFLFEPPYHEKISFNTASLLYSLWYDHSLAYYTRAPRVSICNAFLMV